MATITTRVSSHRELGTTAGEVRTFGERIVVGRSSQVADIVAPHGNISRRHGAIFVRDGRLWLEDAGSTNGLQTVNETMTKGPWPLQLYVGDSVYFGDVRVEIVDFEPCLPVPIEESVQFRRREIVEPATVHAYVRQHGLELEGGEHLPRVPNDLVVVRVERLGRQLQRRIGVTEYAIVSPVWAWDTLEIVLTIRDVSAVDFTFDVVAHNQRDEVVLRGAGKSLPAGEEVGGGPDSHQKS